MLIKSLEDLRIWQDAHRLTVDVYKIFTNNKDYGFRDQIQRASVSIMNNIAEGFDSGTNPQFKKFLNIAKGSCSEVRSMLILAKSLAYIDNPVDLVERTIAINKGITNLIKSIK